MFDSSARLVVGNRRYLEIYGLSPEKTKPGCSLSELIRQRIDAGTFSGDPDKYVADTMREIAQGKAVDKIIEMGDGRVIALANRPMADGGWVVTHDDITEQRNAEQKHASLAEQEHRRVAVEAAIRSFRERVEAALKTVGGSAGAMRATAAALSGSSNQSSQRAEGAVQDVERILRPTSRPRRWQPRSCSPRSPRSAASSSRRPSSSAWRSPKRRPPTTRSPGSPQAAQKIGDVVKLIQRHRRPDQPAGAQRHDRGGARRRIRQGLRRRRLRGEVARGADRQGDRGDRRADLGGAVLDHRRGRSDPPHRRAHAGDQPATRRRVAAAVQEQSAATGQIPTTSPTRPRAAR